MKVDSNVSAPTKFVQVGNERYAYRRFGNGSGLPLLRPSIFRKMILVGTAPRGGKDIMHLEKPSLANYLNDPKLQGYAVLQKIFFAPTGSSQAAGEAFIGRLTERKDDLDPPSGPEVAANQIASFREWEQFSGNVSQT